MNRILREVGNSAASLSLGAFSIAAAIAASLLVAAFSSGCAGVAADRLMDRDAIDSEADPRTGRLESATAFPAGAPHPPLLAHRAQLPLLLHGRSLRSELPSGWEIVTVSGAYGPWLEVGRPPGWFLSSSSSHIEVSLRDPTNDSPKQMLGAALKMYFGRSLGEAGLVGPWPEGTVTDTVRIDGELADLYTQPTVAHGQGVGRSFYVDQADRGGNRAPFHMIGGASAGNWRDLTAHLETLGRIIATLRFVPDFTRQMDWAVSVLRAGMELPRVREYEIEHPEGWRIRETDGCVELTGIASAEGRAGNMKIRLRPGAEAEDWERAQPIVDLPELRRLSSAQSATGAMEEAYLHLVGDYPILAEVSRPAAPSGTDADRMYRQVATRIITSAYFRYWEAALGYPGPREWRSPYKDTDRGHASTGSDPR